MATVSTYLNFKGQTEEAFEFYKSVFGTDYISVMRYGDIPGQDEMPPMSDEAKNQIINVQLPILGGHLLMGSDIPDGMGFGVTAGNNVNICLQPDTRTEADHLFNGLSEGGKVQMAMAEQFWGDYYGDFTDKFGINWQVNCSSKE